MKKTENNKFSDDLNMNTFFYSWKSDIPSDNYVLNKKIIDSILNPDGNNKIIKMRGFTKIAYAATLFMGITIGAIIYYFTFHSSNSKSNDISSNYNKFLRDYSDETFLSEMKINETEDILISKNK